MQEQAARSAGMTAAFCERIGLPALDMLVAKFHGRVLHGIKEDVVALTTIRGVKGYTARLLYTAGLRSVEEVAAAEPEAVHAALVQGKRPDARGGEWRTARQVSASARKIVKVRAPLAPPAAPSNLNAAACYRMGARARAGASRSGVRGARGRAAAAG